MNNEFFNQEAVESFCGTDDLTKTIKMTTPGVWMIGLSCMFLILGILFWGIFGVISTHIETTGMIQNDKVICFLSTEDAAKVSVGNEAVSGDLHMRISSLSDLPLSREEASGIVEGDYFLHVMMPGEWAYTVTFDVEEGDPEKYRGKPLSIRVTTEHTSPIGLIFER